MWDKQAAEVKKEKRGQSSKCGYIMSQKSNDWLLQICGVCQDKLADRHRKLDWDKIHITTLFQIQQA